MKNLRFNPILSVALVALAFLLTAVMWKAKSASQITTVVNAATDPGPRTPVLVELFTYEGCSSCPPADALLAELDQKQFVPSAEAIVLSEHVSYWNGLGWRDPFSSQIFTNRQTDYARRLGIEGPYTPQAVVDGHIDAVGSNRNSLAQAIQAAAIEPKVLLALQNARWENGLASADVVATVQSGPYQNATLMAALADDEDQSSVLRGENEGRSLRHVAVVRNLVELSKKSGPLNSLAIQVKLPSGAPQPKMRLIVFLTDNRSGRILGAAEQTVAAQTTIK